MTKQEIRIDVMNVMSFGNCYIGNKNSTQVKFGSQREKLINEILTSRPKNVQITTDQISYLLLNEGFEVSRGKGAHIVARKEGIKPFVTTSTRTTHKFVDPKAIVWLREYFQTKKV